MRTLRQTLIILTVAVPLAAGIVIVFYKPSTPAPPHGSITVVNSSHRPAAGAMRETDMHATTVVRPPAIRTMIEEAPQMLKAMHDGIGAERDAGRLIEEERVAKLFDSGPFAGKPVEVSCTRRRCEVHGSSDDDEDVTRLAIRDGAFLDRIAAAGYSSGVDMVSGRPEGSEFIVYLEAQSSTEN